MLKRLIGKIASLLLIVVIAMPVVALGADDDGTVETFEAQWNTIAVGSSHTLAIDAEGNLWAWGSNFHGEIGDGTANHISRDPWGVLVDNNRYRPVMVMSNVVSVAAGFDHSMALKEDGSLWAWGNNNLGQVGMGESASTAFPSEWRDGRWHPNLQIFYTPHTAAYPAIILEPTKIMDNVAAISAGHSFSLALKEDGTLWSWGWDNRGQLGHGDSEWRNCSRHEPTPTKIMNSVVAISAGYMHSLAMTSDGTVWAWGSNPFGELGIGTNVDSGIPVRVPIDSVESIIAGVSHSMAVKTDGSLWVWGNNGYGKLGNGVMSRRELILGPRDENGSALLLGIDVIEDNDSNVPIQVMDGVVSTAGGHNQSFAISEDGSLWAMGGVRTRDNKLMIFSEVVGDVPTIPMRASDWLGIHATPDLVNALNSTAAIDKSFSTNGTAMLLAEDGSVWTWGRFSSVLGIGETENFVVQWPMKVMDGIRLPNERAGIITILNSQEQEHVVFPAHQETVTVPDTPQFDAESFGREMLNITNTRRANNGVNLLRLDDTLMEIGRRYARHMADTNADTETDIPAILRQVGVSVENFSEIRGSAVRHLRQTNPERALGRSWLNDSSCADVAGFIAYQDGQHTLVIKLYGWLEGGTEMASPLPTQTPMSPPAQTIPLAPQPLPTPNQQPAPPTLILPIVPTLPSINTADFERDVFELTNAERASHGLPALIWDDSAARAARNHSRDLVVNHLMGHDGSDWSTPGDRLAREGVALRGWGENVISNAAGVAGGVFALGELTPEEQVARWMNSPGHRANILNPNMTHLGVGFYMDIVPAYGMTDGSVIFSSRTTQKFFRWVE